MDATTTTGTTTEGDLQAEPFFDQSGFQRDGNQQGATIMGGVLQTNHQSYQQSNMSWDGNSKGGISSLSGNLGMNSEGIGGFNSNIGGGHGMGSVGTSGGSGSFGGGGNGGGSPGGSASGFGGDSSGGSTNRTSGASGSGWNGGGPNLGHVSFNVFQNSVIADISAGKDIMNQLSKRIDRLESLPDNEDTVILNGTALRTKEDVVGLLESHLGVNCSVPAGTFASPQFLLNEVMLTLGCSMPTLDELTKL